jgi:vancomycin resistance protein YoaR
VAWEVTIALLIVAILVAGVAALFLFELWLVDRVLPGVRVWNIDLGGLTRDQAMERLASNFHYPTNRQLILRYGDQTWSVSAQDLGVQLDAAATVDAALALGHKGDLITRVEEQYDVLLNGRLVRPIFSSDPGAGAMFLRRIAGQVNLPSRNASLSFGDDLGVEVTASQTGREVDEEATRQALVQGMIEMSSDEVDLVVRESEPLLTDLSAAQEKVQQLLSDRIVLTAPEFEPWVIERETLASWLIMEPTTETDGPATLAVSLDPDPIWHFVEEIAPQVAREPQDAQFRFDVGKEEIVTIVESMPGQRLEITATVSLVEGAAASDQRTVPLAFVPILPAIATEDAPRVDAFELIGEGKSNFSGSTAARITNIIVGTSQFDGLLIAPGETFSFNEHLGEVTAEQGYADSIIIWGDQTITDVGGGLCQVSSTAFRAAFWSGLPIVERWPHTFRVSYYEPPKGLDATIYTPHVDLKWVNDTGHHILIRTHVDEAKKTLTFRFLGMDSGRTVEMDGPHESRLVRPEPPIYRDDPTRPKGQTKQIQWAKDGLDVTVYRIVKENGEEVRRDKFFSRYQPWQAVYLRGTKEE